MRVIGGKAALYNFGCDRIASKRLCYTNPMKDSFCESGVVARLQEQTDTPRLEGQELGHL